MSDDAGQGQGTLSSSAVPSSSRQQEGTTWYRPTNEANDGEGAAIDRGLFRVEERQGAWWLLRLPGMTALLLIVWAAVP